MADPTVGRIVHYYDVNAFGDNGHGPYAALVSRVIEPGIVDLMVCMAGWVPATAVDTKVNNSVRYWEWPPQA